MLGAAVIGLGVGRQHCRAYADGPDARLLAVSDLVDERLQWARDAYRVDTYRDYREMLERDDIQVVSVCTPEFTHAKITIDALEAGKHVMCEKPMAVVLEDCDRMIETARRKGLKLCIDQNTRMSPSNIKIQGLIQSGSLGRLVCVAIDHQRGSFQLDKPGRWIQQRKYAGSMIAEGAIHPIDTLMTFGGAASEVYAAGAKALEAYDYEQIAYISVKFKSGAIGHLFFTILGGLSLSTTRVVGTKAAVYMLRGRTPQGPISSFTIRDHMQPAKEAAKPIEVESRGKDRQDIFQAFIQAVLRDRTPPVPGEDGRRNVEIALAADQSIQTGQVVKLPLTKTPDFITQALAPPDQPYITKP